MQCQGVHVYILLCLIYKFSLQVQFRLVKLIKKYPLDTMMMRLYLKFYMSKVVFITELEALSINPKPEYLETLDVSQ